MLVVVSITPQLKSEYDDIHLFLAVWGSWPTHDMPDPRSHMGHELLPTTCQSETVCYDAHKSLLVVVYSAALAEN